MLIIPLFPLPLHFFSCPVNQLLLLPFTNWAEKNVHLAKALEISGEIDSTVFRLDFAHLRERMESIFAQTIFYTPCNNAVKLVMTEAINAVSLQEYRFETRCLKDGSHAYWRQYQSTIKRWSSVVDSLVHERGPWGELHQSENE